MSHSVASSVAYSFLESFESLGSRQNTVGRLNFLNLVNHLNRLNQPNHVNLLNQPSHPILSITSITTELAGSLEYTEYYKFPIVRSNLLLGFKVDFVARRHRTNFTHRFPFYSFNVPLYASARKHRPVYQQRALDKQFIPSIASKVFPYPKS